MTGGNPVKLVLDHNMIAKVSHQLPLNVLRVSLQSNKIERVDVQRVAAAGKLREINLSKNKICKFHKLPVVFGSLRVLNLSQNLLTDSVV